MGLALTKCKKCFLKFNWQLTRPTTGLRLMMRPLLNLLLSHLLRLSDVYVGNRQSNMSPVMIPTHFDTPQIV